MLITQKSNNSLTQNHRNRRFRCLIEINLNKLNYIYDLSLNNDSNLHLNDSDIKIITAFSSSPVHLNDDFNSRFILHLHSLIILPSYDLPFFCCLFFNNPPFLTPIYSPKSSSSLLPSVPELISQISYL